MELSEIIPHIEVLIFASEKPLTSLDIVELINNAFGFMEERITLDQVESCVEGIREKYQSEFYPFEVRESGGGWQFLTKKDFHKTVAQLNGDRFLKRLSNAALETLAIIAYKAPITKGEIEAIRGVNSDYSIQKLLEKELIVISGRNETLPGKPLVYSTSKSFMDYFGLNSTDDLPKIKEVLAEQMVEPTQVSGTEAEQEEASPLAVNSNGDLIAHEDPTDAADAAIDATVSTEAYDEIAAHEEDTSSQSEIDAIVSAEAYDQIDAFEEDHTGATANETAPDAGSKQDEDKTPPPAPDNDPASEAGDPTEE